MVAKWPKHVGEIFRVLYNTYVLMCCFIKYINWVQLVGMQIYNLNIARIKNNTKKWNSLCYIFASKKCAFILERFSYIQIKSKDSFHKQ